jgi:hypothetical protein
LLASQILLWNKNRSKLSEFRSEPLRRRENNSEFHSVEQKYKQTFGIFFAEAFRGRKHALNFHFL